MNGFKIRNCDRRAPLRRRWHFRSQTHCLQLFEERVLGAPLFRGLGNVQVKAVAAPQCIEAQDEGHVILQQAGVYKGIQESTELNVKPATAG